MKYKELEFKYKAEGIGLKKAIEVFESLDDKRKLEEVRWELY